MKKIILILLIGIFLISFISPTQQSLGTFKRGEDINLIQICDNCSYNNISTILFPNSSVILSNVAMTKDDTYYNYTFGNTSTLGTYIVNGFGDLDGVKTAWSYDFDVTDSGSYITEGNATLLYTIILFMMVVGTIFLIAFTKKGDKFQIKWTFFVVGYILFLSALTLAQISLRDSLVNPVIISFLDSFLGIAFLLFWFSFGLLIVIWFLTTLQTLLLKKTQRNLEKYQ